MNNRNNQGEKRIIQRIIQRIIGIIQQNKKNNRDISKSGGNYLGQIMTNNDKQDAIYLTLFDNYLIIICNYLTII